MRPTLNRMAILCSFVIAVGCNHWPAGSDQDSEVSPDTSQYQDDASVTSSDGAMNTDAVVNHDAGTVADGNTGDSHDGSVDDAADGGTGDARDGGSNSDSGAVGCSFASDCPEGEDCVNGQCVCDGGDGDEFCESHHKTWVCHYPPGNPDNPQNICVGMPSVPAHQAHGDTLGVCP